MKNDLRGTGLCETTLGEPIVVRLHTGLSDISYLGRLLLEGVGAAETLQRLVAVDVSCDS